MRNTTKKRGLFIATAVLLSSVVAMPTASADEAHAVVDSSTIVLGEIDGNATVKTLEALGLQIDGKQVARYVRNPAKHWDPKKAQKVPFAKNYWAGVRSGKPFRLHHGQKYPDTYIGMAADMTEHDIAVRNRVQHKWQLFDFKNGQVRNRGFWTGTKWVGDCVNPKPSTPPTVDVSSLHIVKQFNGFKVNVMGSLSLWAMTSGMVEVNCGSSWARAQYSAKAEAELEGSVTVKAKTRAEALVKGAEALKAKYTNSEDAKLKLHEDAKLKLEGAAEAWCEGGNQPPSTTAPSVSASPEVCTTPGGVAPNTLVVNGTNNDEATRTLVYKVTDSVGTTKIVERSVAAGQTTSVSFSGLALGNVTYSVTVKETSKANSGSAQLNPCPPQQTPAPKFQDISLVNFVYVGHQITLSVSGTTANGHTADLFCRALNGGTVTSATNRQSITTSPFTKSFDYVAPGEIPGALKDSAGNVIVPAGHDMVECVVTQDDGQTDTIRTVAGPGQFEIRNVPPQSE